MKYVINNYGILATIGYIKTKTGVDIMPSLQNTIAYQFEDGSGYIIHFTDDSVENLTGIRSIVIDREQVEALEPIDLTGWIPVERADELPDDIDNYQACIVARDVEAIEKSDFESLDIGCIYNKKVRVFNPNEPVDDEVTEGLFKLITL